MIFDETISLFGQAEQGHVVAFDRFFTSIDLLDRLNRNGINAVGSILPSRVNQPIMMKNESNLQQDEFVAKFGGEPRTCRKGIFIWRDTKAFFSLPTTTAQRLSRSKGSSAMVLSERSLVPKLLPTMSTIWAGWTRRTSCNPTTRETANLRNGGIVTSTDGNVSSE